MARLPSVRETLAALEAAGGRPVIAHVSFAGARKFSFTLCAGLPALPRSVPNVRTQEPPRPTAGSLVAAVAEITALPFASFALIYAGDVFVSPDDETVFENNAEFELVALPGILTAPTRRVGIGAK